MPRPVRLENKRREFAADMRAMLQPATVSADVGNAATIPIQAPDGTLYWLWGFSQWASVDKPKQERDVFAGVGM